jgi:transposase
MVVMEKSPTTRRYSVEFKRDAVALYRSSGRSLREVAKELGITDMSLAAWVKEAEGSSDDNKGDKETAREEARLRKRIRELEEEVEILKRFTKYWVREGDK